MTTILNADFWSERYEKSETGWDVGEATLPIKQYLDQIENKGIKILFPGAGNAYEAEYAFKSGFHQTTILDFSPIPIQTFKDKNPEFPTDQIHIQDFFQHEGTYDLIVEQTFFCALEPVLRRAYAAKMQSLLVPKGKLVGVLFDKVFEKPGPPFGGSKKEYHALFSDHFDVKILEQCYNSIPPRTGAELFVLLQNR